MHVLLWRLDDNSQLGLKVGEAISEIRNTVYISAATSWEISIKKALGKLKIPDDIENIVLRMKDLKSCRLLSTMGSLLAVCRRFIEIL